MSAFAVIRDSVDLLPACKDLSEFISRRFQRYPVGEPEQLLGLWLDSRLEDLPSIMALPGDSYPPQRISVAESAGLSGIWTLCWLDPLTDISNTRMARLALLEALLAESAQTQDAPTQQGAFVPVFSADMEASDIVAEMDRLRDHHGQVLDPVFQDPYSGVLSLSAGSGSPVGPMSVALSHRYA